MLQGVEFLSVDLGPRLPESEDRRQIESGEDGHERVEVADVVALLGHVNEEVDLQHSMTFFTAETIEELVNQRTSSTRTDGRTDRQT